MTVEWLNFVPQNPKATQICGSLMETASSSGVSMRVGQSYHGKSDVLCLWGPGAPNRWPAMRAQQAKGKHVAVWDLAYWQRDAKVRVSIDAAHPQRWVMKKDWPASRFQADGVAMQSAWKPDGPVIVAGIGAKAKVQYGADVVAAWECAQIRACQALGRKVLYRRKYGQGDAPMPVSLAEGSDIDSTLRGASLLVTWHSNVAVDAIRLGIPVVCKDGAASAVCGSEVRADLKPLAEDVRLRFLHNLAWFQWAPSEATQCWGWLREVLA